MNRLIEIQPLWNFSLRVLKILPIVGMIFVIAGIPDVLRRKGYIFGLLAVALDTLPIVCLIKAGIEIFKGGDLIPDTDKC